MTFLVVWLASCAAVGGLVWAGFNYDEVALFFLRLLNAQVYQEARRVAGSIYQRPEQWKLSTYHLEHPTLGSIHVSSVLHSLDVNGPGFGVWEPTAIERRIIFDTVQWYRRVYIRSLMGAALERAP